MLSIKTLKYVKEIINLHDDVGVWAITSKMVFDYIKNKDRSITEEEVKQCFDILSKNNKIVFDKTRSFVRPVKLKE